MDGVPVVPQERVQNCSLDQFVDVPVPQIMAKLGVSVRPVPLERIPRTIVDQISVVPQSTEEIVSAVQPVPPERIRERLVQQISIMSQTTEKVAHCIRDQIVEVPVPLITEKIVDDVFGLPQERVQNRATFTGKVFTVCHHFDDQACTVDNVGFFKGLDKYNMP